MHLQNVKSILKAQEKNIIVLKVYPKIRIYQRWIQYILKFTLVNPIYWSDVPRYTIIDEHLTSYNVCGGEERERGGEEGHDSISKQSINVDG